MRLSALAMLAAISVAHSPPSEAQAPAVDAFARLPAMANPTLSPDGNRLAYIANDHQASALYILDIETGDRRGIGVDQIRPQELMWAGNDYVIMRASQADRFTRFGRRNPVDIAAAFSVEAYNPANTVQLMQGDRQIHPRNLNLANIVGINAETGDLFIPAYEAPRQSGVSSSRGSDAIQNPRHTLWRVAADGSNVSRAMQGLPEVYNWFVDTNGRPIGREYYDNERNIYRFYGYRGGEWETLIERETPVLQAEVIGFFSPEEAVLDRYINGYRALQMLDVTTGTETNDVTGIPGRDILDYFTDPYTNYIVGLSYDDNGPRSVWFDDQLQSLQSALANALGDESVSLVSWSQDRSRVVIRADSGAAVPAYYLYDDTARNLSPLAGEYPDLENITLGHRQARTFTARDGTQIPGYLTLPPGGEQNLPAIVLPHGGPESQDIGGFDYWAHFLASRGYAVIQPNFRGSTGYGIAFRDAGRGAWGTGVAQTDVIDALDAVINEGVVDPDRVCIVGASYGGYAALAGGAFTPDRFACVAAYAPVTDLPRFLGEGQLTFGGTSWVVAYWRRVFGTEVSTEERLRLEAVSPIYFAREFTTPVLLMHGRDDSVVPITQSRRMEDALDDAGKEVTYVELRGADHWLTNRQTRMDVLSNLDAFLAEHLSD